MNEWVRERQIERREAVSKFLMAQVPAMISAACRDPEGAAAGPNGRLLPGQWREERVCDGPDDGRSTGTRRGRAAACQMVEDEVHERQKAAQPKILMGRCAFGEGCMCGRPGSTLSKYREAEETRYKEQFYGDGAPAEFCAGVHMLRRVSLVTEG